MNAPDPLHWTLDSCIAAFHSVWVHFGLFRYCMKLGTKWAELVQLMHMFLPRSRIRIFRNERTRSTPLAPKLMFWCVSYHWVHSGPFGRLTKIGAKRAELVRSCHKVVSEFFATNAPDPTRWSLNSCFGASRSVWVHFGLFHYCTKLGTKWAELVQLMHMFLPRSRIRIFRNERTRSTPLDPKLMFWCIALYLVAFSNVSLVHKTRCKTG